MIGIPCVGEVANGWIGVLDRCHVTIGIVGSSFANAVIIATSGQAATIIVGTGVDRRRTKFDGVQFPSGCVAPRNFASIRINELRYAARGIILRGTRVGSSRNRERLGGFPVGNDIRN